MLSSWQCFIFHQKYGEQFQTENYERCQREDKDSIIEFLTSGLFKGIGEKKAKKNECYCYDNANYFFIFNPNF